MSATDSEIAELGFGPSGWPRAGSIEEQWQTPDTEFSPRVRKLRSGPYLAVNPARIAEVHWQATPKLAAICEAAALEATKFDARLDSSVWSYDIVLLRSEAAASSQIEQLTASPRAILQAEIGDTTRPNATLIAANASALRAGLEIAHEITVDSILSVHRRLLASSPALNPGVFRTVPVWIGGNNPIDATFVGAPHEAISELMDDLIKFCNRTDVPMVVQAAISHAQFELIHPFEDGNGRVGRALFHMMLRNADVLTHSVLPVSGELLKRSRDYYDALSSYRMGEPEPIISLFADSLLAAVSNGGRLMADIAAVRENWLARLNLRSDSGAYELLRYALRQPVFTAERAKVDLGIGNPSFYRYANLLTEAGILTRSKFYRDSGVWRAQDVLDAMQDFADRAGFRKPA